jgi:hypothetical protein
MAASAVPNKFGRIDRVRVGTRNERGPRIGVRDTNADSGCLMFAWISEHRIVVNLFALRSTDLSAPYEATDSVGPDNFAAIAIPSARRELCPGVFE